MKKFALVAMLAFAFSAGTQAAVLTTTFANNNSHNGNMFDLVTKGRSLTVTGFDLNLDPGYHTVEIYRKDGSWVGAPTDRNAWSMVDTLGITSNGAGAATFLDLADFHIDAGSTTGLYITISSGGWMNYTNGSSVGAVAAEDDYVQILQGAGKGYAFGDTFTPRIWNGSIHYQPAGNDVPEPGSLALLGLGMAGLSLLRRKQA